MFSVPPVPVISELEKKYSFSVWKKIDENNAALLLITSWPTPENQVDDFIADLCKSSEASK
ncbi:hypothetical protein JHJ32_05445 [Parapedobacter sp. ISTM3]|uniref:hypothetical protein n=1 Tax=Parapedobacter sp. ISTM3 TaxID=2800130 RepID=UPI0009A7A784|nr:hypothetical protein [Parapedobacter sp. ISTM3]MBK1439422.1 hypothetical protein [Parapedobacter sp. ISTM3]